MRLLLQLLLATTLIVNVAISTATSLPPPKRGDVLTTDRNSVSNGRSLRAQSDTAEERESLLSKIGNNIQVRWWLEAEKTDDFVKEALKLKRLTGEEKNKYFRKFAKKAETYRLNKWLRENLPTYEAWLELGIQKILTGKQLDEIKNTNQFRIYKRYVNELDDYALRTMESGYNPPKGMVAWGASKAEMTARVQIMAESKRSTAYAKLALGMTERGKPKITLKGEALEKHRAFPYFEMFLEEAAKVAAKTNAVA